MAKKLSSLPIGTKVSIGANYYDEDITFLLADKTKYNVLITERIITIKAFDAKEPKSGNEHRQYFGNNRYKLSNLLQWLNSNEIKWYKPTHSADEPPSSGVSYNPYVNESGFLTNIPKDILDVILTTKHTVLKPGYDGGGSESHSSKIYLPSRTEIGLDDGGMAEGVKWELFTSSGDSRKAYPTAKAVSNSYYQDSNLSSGKAWYYWLRSPYTSFSYNMHVVNPSGNRDTSGANSGNRGVRPALNLPSDIMVEENPVNGVYKITTNTAPTIKVTTSDNQQLFEGSTLELKGSTLDVDNGDSITIKYKVNSGTTRNIKAYVSEGKEVQFSKSLKYTNGNLMDGNTVVASNLADTKHSITLWAEDGSDKSNEHKVYFTTKKNRPPILEVTKYPTDVKDLIIIDAVPFEFKVTDPDEGAIITTVYKLNDGKEVSVKGSGGLYKFDLKVSDLKVGANTIEITAYDQYKASDSKKVRLTVGSTKKKAKEQVIRYDVTPPTELDIKGLISWVKHMKDDSVVLKYRDANDDASQFLVMEHKETVSPTGMKETEFSKIFDKGITNLQLELSNADKATLIMGGLDTDES